NGRRTALLRASRLLGVVVELLVVDSVALLDQAEVLTDPAHGAAHESFLRCCVPRSGTFDVGDITGPAASPRGPHGLSVRVSRRAGSPRRGLRSSRPTGVSPADGRHGSARR